MTLLSDTVVSKNIMIPVSTIHSILANLIGGIIQFPTMFTQISFNIKRFENTKARVAEVRLSLNKGASSADIKMFCHFVIFVVNTIIILIGIYLYRDKICHKDN